MNLKLLICMSSLTAVACAATKANFFESGSTVSTTLLTNEEFAEQKDILQQELQFYINCQRGIFADEDPKSKEFLSMRFSEQLQKMLSLRTQLRQLDSKLFQDKKMFKELLHDSSASRSHSMNASEDIYEGSSILGSVKSSSAMMTLPEKVQEAIENTEQYFAAQRQKHYSELLSQTAVNRKGPGVALLRNELRELELQYHAEKELLKKLQRKSKKSSEETIASVNESLTSSRLRLEETMMEANPTQK